MPLTYRVTHRTAYEYAADVAPSYSQLHLLPRDAPGQRCRSSEISVDPRPAVARERVDFFGNRVMHVAIDEPHRALTVTATSVVEVGERGAPPPARRPWEAAAAVVSDARAAEHVEAVAFALDSPLVIADELYADYAGDCFAAGRDLIDAVTALCARVHRDFAYEPGATSVSTPLAEAFAARAGVCQDFAHIAIACLRSLGLPARYVSGYMVTDPPPGQPKLVGADASHAWPSVLVPGAGWLDFDPTNDQLVGSRHVVTAYGRDYGDVAPLSGVIFTDGRTTSLKAEVDVVPIDG